MLMTWTASLLPFKFFIFNLLFNNLLFFCTEQLLKKIKKAIKHFYCEFYTHLRKNIKVIKT